MVSLWNRGQNPQQVAAGRPHRATGVHAGGAGGLPDRGRIRGERARRGWLRPHRHALSDRRCRGKHESRDGCRSRSRPGRWLPIMRRPAAAGRVVVRPGAAGRCGRPTGCRRPTADARKSVAGQAAADGRPAGSTRASSLRGRGRADCNRAAGNDTTAAARDRDARPCPAPKRSKLHAPDLARGLRRSGQAFGYGKLACSSALAGRQGRARRWSRMAARRAWASRCRSCEGAQVLGVVYLRQPLAPLLRRWRRTRRLRAPTSRCARAASTWSSRATSRHCAAAPRTARSRAGHRLRVVAIGAARPSRACSALDGLGEFGIALLLAARRPACSGACQAPRPTGRATGGGRRRQPAPT